MHAINCVLLNDDKNPMSEESVFALYYIFSLYIYTLHFRVYCKLMWLFKKNVIPRDKDIAKTVPADRGLTIW